MNRSEIEAVAQRILGAETRLDGVDDVIVQRLMLAKVPGVNCNGSPTYVAAAFEALAGKLAAAQRRDGAERVIRTHEGAPSTAASRAAMVAEAEQAWRSPLTARIDDAGAAACEGVPRVDSSMSIEQFEVATAKARAGARADAEGEWQKPLRGGARVEA